MASVAILVNGLPASGKSSLAAQLGLLLGCPVLSKDAIKEPFGALMGPRSDSRRLGALAMDTLWLLAAETDGGVVVDAVLPRERDLEHVRRGLVVAGFPRAVEVWCDVPAEVANSRFATRAPERAATHRGEVDPRVETMEPLGDWPLIRVDTTSTVDFDALVQELGAAFL